MLLINWGYFFTDKLLCDLKLSERREDFENARPNLTKPVGVNWDDVKEFFRVEALTRSSFSPFASAQPIQSISGLGVNRHPFTTGNR